MSYVVCDLVVPQLDTAGLPILHNLLGQVKIRGSIDCRSPAAAMVGSGGDGLQCVRGWVGAVCVHFIAFGAASHCVACACSFAGGPGCVHDRRSCSPPYSACLLKMTTGCVLVRSLLQRVFKLRLFGQLLAGGRML